MNKGWHHLARITALHAELLILCDIHVTSCACTTQSCHSFPTVGKGDVTYTQHLLQDQSTLCLKSGRTFKADTTGLTNVVLVIWMTQILLAHLRIESIEWQ